MFINCGPLCSFTDTSRTVGQFSLVPVTPRDDDDAEDADNGDDEHGDDGYGVDDDVADGADCGEVVAMMSIMTTTAVMVFMMAMTMTTDAPCGVDSTACLRCMLFRTQTCSAQK